MMACEGKEMVWSSGGRSFQRRGAVMDLTIEISEWSKQGS